VQLYEAIFHFAHGKGEHGNARPQNMNWDAMDQQHVPWPSLTNPSHIHDEGFFTPIDEN